jgi:hypothetical protein
VGRVVNKEEASQGSMRASKAHDSTNTKAKLLRRRQQARETPPEAEGSVLKRRLEEVLPLCKFRITAGQPGDWDDTSRTSFHPGSTLTNCTWAFELAFQKVTTATSSDSFILASFTFHTTPILEHWTAIWLPFWTILLSRWLFEVFHAHCHSIFTFEDRSSSSSITFKRATHHPTQVSPCSKPHASASCRTCSTASPSLSSFLTTSDYQPQSTTPSAAP